MTSTCKLCLAPSSALTPFLAPERMFGTGESFPYLECTSCGTLQIATIPPDLARHYPAAYYSFHQKPRKLQSGPLARWRAGRLLARQTFASARQKGIWQTLSWPAAARCTTTSKILDIGCGDGITLRRLRALGFISLQGADPFLPESITTPEGIPLHKSTPSQLTGTFDAILMDHAFEHVPDPDATLRDLRRLLSPQGTALIAIPVADCHSWREFKDAWFGLDAPRHLVIPSDKGMRLLAQRAGMTVDSAHYYSTRHHLMWNDMYRRNIPLEGPTGMRTRNLRKEFGKHTLRALTAKATQNNAQNSGDVAVFLLRAQCVALSTYTAHRRRIQFNSADGDAPEAWRLQPQVQ